MLGTDILSTAEKAFVTAFAATGNAFQSYRLAYPRASEASCRAAASKLLDRPRVAKAVASQRIVFDAAKEYLETPQADKPAALKRLIGSATAELAALERLLDTAPAA
jgi:hypothetical protein